jgi:hypothetical protein
MKYYDMVVDDLQVAGVVMMTGHAILDWHNAFARLALSLALAPSTSGARVSALRRYEFREM